MKKALFFLVLFFVAICSIHAQAVINPTIKSATTFVIIIDSTSLSKAPEALHAYKQTIEEDGLATYIFSKEWQSPDEIKSILLELYHNDNSPLEGVVFIGNIPIPMLRDAQHLTSAFKMDQERYPWNRSSVPSDRFYDDFDLKFDFLKQDSDDPRFFYYSLRSDGTQHLQSDIYSARIMPYDNEKGDKYTHLKNYLCKVVEERKINKNNTLDQLSMGRGHGYNSESKIAWASEQLALKEQFPLAFSSKGKVNCMDFDSRWPIKDYFLRDLQRPKLDMMLFHHHGSNDVQFLNGYKNGSDPSTSRENIKLYARNKIRSAAKKKSKEEAIKQYVDYLKIPDSWVEDTFDSTRMREDSLINLLADIHVVDIQNITPSARFIMFDACYNGSFYEKENIAGSYIFNQGKTIAAQGNTVNVIQDKWSDEFLGLLTLGTRVGNWHRLVNYLETHLIGDPTFRFKNDNTGIKLNMNNLITEKNKSNEFWLLLLKKNNVDLQCLALRKLYNNGYPGISRLLKKTYIDSPNIVTRTEAFFLLSKISDTNFTNVLELAIYDSYELIRRFAIEFIAKNGSKKLVPAFAKSIFWDETSERVGFKQQNYLKILPIDELKRYVSNFAKDNKHYQEKAEELLSKIERQEESFKKTTEIILAKDSTTTEKNKLFEIRHFRNHPDAKAVEILLSVVADKSISPKLRISAAEALGWYNYSHRKSEITARLQALQLNENIPEIKNEIRKTINRLFSAGWLK